MPARTEHGNKTKKKGRAPAHQNKFGFKHNPASKKTEKILSLPIIHVCQRCYDKIEWRKKYRKYKPRTQPGKCNGCEKRNVKAAYHTICTRCTTESARAKEVIKKARQESPEIDEDTTIIRACAVCVNEIALPDPVEEDDREMVDAMSRLKLRQRKALERKLAKEQKELEREAENDDNDENDNENEDDNREIDDINQQQESLDPLIEEELLDDDNVYPDYGDDEEDPFLKAVGGADKLLTGEAYQQKLLRQQQKEQQ